MSLIKFNSISDNRGSLISIEANKNIPFEIKRVYYIFNLRNSARGFHAHKQLRQFFICLSGSCTIKIDTGINVNETNLSSPEVGILIEPMEWHEMYNFSTDCLIMVLANDVYDESDYIRNYDEFLRLL